MYHEGYGVNKDYSEAVHWFQLAAEQGLPIAQFDLAVAYLRGDGIKQDDIKAATWYSKSTEQGFVSAMAGISDMCQHGRGMKRDLVCAYRWLTLELCIVEATPDNPNTYKDEVAKDKRNYAMLSEQLTSAQRQEADDWVKEWFAAHTK